MATPSPWVLLVCATKGMTGKTNLRHAIDKEVGEDSVGKGSRGRGQSSEKHRLGLHRDWCLIVVRSRGTAIVFFSRSNL
jgi:hypothetical protein